MFLCNYCEKAKNIFYYYYFKERCCFEIKLKKKVYRACNKEVFHESSPVCIIMLIEKYQIISNKEFDWRYYSAFNKYFLQFLMLSLGFI